MDDSVFDTVLLFRGLLPPHVSLPGTSERLVIVRLIFRCVLSISGLCHLSVHADFKKFQVV